MERAVILLRLCCFGVGTAVEILLSDTAVRRLVPHPQTARAQLMRLMIGITKTVVCCAAVAVAVPLPVSVSILYAGFGMLAAHSLAKPVVEVQPLPVICSWVIVFLPFTGVLACLGGGLLVLAADVPQLAGLAILILGAPMALLQVGTEGGLILLASAALVCARTIAEWSNHRTGLHPG